MPRKSLHGKPRSIEESIEGLFIKASKHRSPQGFAAELRSGLLQIRNQCLQEIKEFQEDTEPYRLLDQTQQTIKQSILYIEQASNMACTAIRSQIDQAIRYARDYRAFKDDRDLDRGSWRPDPEVAFLIAIVLLLPEAVGTGAMLAMDGRLGITQALIYGLFFATATSILSLFTGFFCLRYALRTMPKNPGLHEQLSRDLARIGLFIGPLLVVLLIFITCRVRAVGGHEFLFDFSTVGLASTFNDGVSLVIIAISGVAACMNIITGCIAFSDIEPGFTALLRLAEDRAPRDAQHCHDATINDIDNAYESALDGHEQDSDELDAIAAEADERRVALSMNCHRCNEAVHKAKGAIHLLITRRAAVEAISPNRIAGSLDISVFNELLISIPEVEARLSRVPRITADSSLINQLNTARDQALALVNCAHTEFCQATSNVVLNVAYPPLDETEDEGETSYA